MYGRGMALATGTWGPSMAADTLFHLGWTLLAIVTIVTVLAAFFRMMPRKEG
jgi:hypothetical protein